MIAAGDLRSGKTHRDENFPVASRIIHPRHRALILAFYNFVRTADDIADHPTLGDTEKLALLDELDTGLTGHGPAQPEAIALRDALGARKMPPRHARDVLTAFRMDVTKRRYSTWDELIHYCSYSAMPVGRFMLDVHGESTSTWAASDALCAALQINNHLQDCGDDLRDLDRCYIPDETLRKHHASPEDLKASRASGPLRACVRELAGRTEALLRESKMLSAQVVDKRLGCEIAVIDSYASRIVALLKERDPLSERVHLSKVETLGLAASAVAGELFGRAFGSRPLSRTAPRA